MGSWERIERKPERLEAVGKEGAEWGHEKKSTMAFLQTAEFFLMMETDSQVANVESMAKTAIGNRHGYADNVQT